MNKKSKDRVCTVIVLCYELVFAAAFYVVSNDMNKIMGTNLLLSFIQITGYCLISFALASLILRLVVGEALVKIFLKKRKLSSHSNRKSSD